MRKPRRLVKLEDIISNEILGDDPEVLALAIKIHLALEAILLELILSFREDDKIYKLTFPAKSELLLKQGLITAHDHDAFILFNDFRNDFAHIFGHRIGLNEVLTLARELENNGVDFSDSVGHYTPAEAEQYYDGLLGVLEEVGWCILYHAAFILLESGGRDLFSATD